VAASDTERVFNFDRIAASYDALASATEPFVSKQRKELLCLSQGLALEVGAGTGEDTKDYPPAGSLVATDVS